MWRRVVNIEQRIVELETKVAYQDATILSLDEVIREFTGRAVALEAEVKALRETISAMAPSGPANDPPPHY